MGRGVLYLSGGMEKAVDLGSSWRRECSQRLVEIDYTPIDITALDKLYTSIHGPVYVSDDDTNFLQNKSNIRRQFIYTDLELIKHQADAVVSFYDESFRLGAGSFAECQSAYDLGKPLFLVSDFGSMSDIPAWLKALTTRTFLSFEDLYQYLDRLPHNILKIDTYGNHHTQRQYLCSLCGNVFEKTKQHFVSKIIPLYCKSCVEVVARTHEEHADRYRFAVEYLNTFKFI